MQDEKPTTVATVKFRKIKVGSLIKDINVGVGFYNRLQDLLKYHYDSKTPEEGLQALLSLKTGEPKNDFEAHLVTIMSLMYEIEVKAEAQGLIETEEVTPPQD